MNKGFENIKVQIMNIDNEPYKKIWDWFKVIWYKTNELEYDSTNPVIIGHVKDVLDFKALPTGMETIGITFNITGLSRVALARITRSRVGWAFNSFSQAPQRVEIDPIIPLNIYESKHKERAIRLVEEIESLYNDLYDEGIPPQDIRYLTLMGDTGELRCHTNFLALRSFFSRRACNGLEDELNYICRLIVREIKNKILDGELSNDWIALLKYLNCGCTFKKTCNNIDKVYGCCGRYGNKSTTADFDFDKSCWVKELERLPEDMLFEGEKQAFQR